jgi:glycosyltransferase involved in cell wall biosynthesis
MSERPRKLLFLAYYFPPAAAVASVRSWNTVGYMARLGWEVTVVTPRPDVWRRAEDPHAVAAALHQKRVRRIATGHPLRWLDTECFPFSKHGPIGLATRVCRRCIGKRDIEFQFGWYWAALRACRHLTPDDVDVILATGGPFVSFRVAAALAERLRKPFVLDYRDLWTNSPRRNFPDSHRLVSLERRLLARCAAVIAVSEGFAGALHERFGVASKTNVITNGYDSEELSTVAPQSFGHRAVVYAGRFYPPQSQIGPVMAAIRELEAATGDADGAPEWRFHYYGPQGEHVREEAARLGVLPRVVVHGVVPRSEVLSALRGACASVVITLVKEEGTIADLGIVAAKVYEPIGLGTPVLLIAPRESDAARIVEEHGGGRRFCGTDIKGIAAFLRATIHGALPRPVPPPRYAWPTLATHMDEVLTCASRQTYPFGTTSKQAR